MRLQDFMADKLDETTGWMIKGVEKMGPDKAAYRPTVGEHSARSALGMIGELVLSNRNWAETLERNDGKHMPPPSELWATMEVEYQTKPLGEAVAELRDSTARLAMAIRALADEQMNSTIESPWFEKMVEVETFAAMASDNTQYHVGQINYIQTLYGDTDM